MEEYSWSSHEARQRYQPPCAAVSAPQRSDADEPRSAPPGGGALEREGRSGEAEKKEIHPV